MLAAALSLARGDALAAARRLEQRLRHLQEHRLQLGAALGLLVDAYLDAGQLDPAAGAAARLAATAAAGTSLPLAALAAYASGRVALARGDGAAIADLEAALTLWSSLELPLEAARARLELARALAASESETAIEHARHALAGFESLGAARDADRAAAFLRSAGVVPRTGPKGTGTLTAREREVLALVGAGLSNPEIAARLHISRKTASHHVSSILTKLGLRNRAEVGRRTWDGRWGSCPMLTRPAARHDRGHDQHPARRVLPDSHRGGRGLRGDVRARLFRPVGPDPVRRRRHRRRPHGARRRLRDRDRRAVAAERAGAAQVTGVDLNEAMLTVARRVRADIDWRHGDAAALPLAGRSFDAVLCQMALMFFPDPIGALREMARVAVLAVELVARPGQPAHQEGLQGVALRGYRRGRGGEQALVGREVRRLVVF